MKAGSLIRKFKQAKKIKKIGIYEPVLNRILNQLINTKPLVDNQNPCEAIVITNKQIKERISRLFPIKKDQIKKTEVLITIISDKFKAPISWFEDGVICSYNMMLAAYELSVNSIYIKVYKENHYEKSEEIKKILKIPDKYTVISLIMIGQAVDYKEQSHTPEIDKVLHHDAFKHEHLFNQ